MGPLPHPRRQEQVHDLVAEDGGDVGAAGRADRGETYDERAAAGVCHGDHPRGLLPDEIRELPVGAREPDDHLSLVGEAEPALHLGDQDGDALAEVTDPLLGALDPAHRGEEQGCQQTQHREDRTLVGMRGISNAPSEMPKRLRVTAAPWSSFGTAASIRG